MANVQVRYMDPQMMSVPSQARRVVTYGPEMPALVPSMHARPMLTTADVKWADDLIENDFNPSLSPQPYIAETESDDDSNNSVFSDENSLSSILSGSDEGSPLLSSCLSPRVVGIGRPLLPLDEDASSYHTTLSRYEAHRRAAGLSTSLPVAGQAPINPRIMAYDPRDDAGYPTTTKASHASTAVSASSANASSTANGHGPLPHVVLSPPPEPRSYVADLHIEPLSLGAAQAQRASNKAGAAPAPQTGGKRGMPNGEGKRAASGQGGGGAKRHRLNSGAAGGGGYPATIGGLLSASRSLLNGGDVAAVPAPKKGGSGGSTKKRGGSGGTKKGVSKAQSSGKPRRFCHICRSPKDLDKIVFCASKKQSHVFCAGCVGRRLGLTFEELVNNDQWMCPKCEGHCPCSKCRKRYPQQEAAAAANGGK